MKCLSLELVTAPRLEQDVCTFYKDVRFKRHTPDLSYQEQSDAVIDSFRTALLQYFKDWNILMLSHKHYDFSFWTSSFRKAYISVLYEHGMTYFAPAADRNETWLVNQIALKLQRLYKTTGFVELLNKVNNDYEKSIEKIRTSYCSTSEFSIDAIDLRFDLGFYDQLNALMDIQQVIDKLRGFEKQLKIQDWYRAQVIYTFYHVFRDVERHRYVVCLFLTIDKAMYSSETKYGIFIAQLWDRVTNGYGGLLPKVDDHLSVNPNHAGGLTPLVIASQDIFNVAMALNPLDYLDSLPANETGLTESFNKICVFMNGFSAFRGFSAMKGCSASRSGSSGRISQR